MPALCERILDTMHNAKIIAALQTHNDQINQPALPFAQMACGVILHIIMLLDQLLDAGSRLRTHSRKLIEHLGDCCG